MWTRPSDRAPSYGPCGQALEKLALPHRLPTLGALAPTSSPLLQQRFMRTATAPTPTASQIAPSSQAIRLRNKPANSPEDSTRQSAKQHPAMPPNGYCVYAALRRCQGHRLIFRRCVRRRSAAPPSPVAPESSLRPGYVVPRHQCLAPHPPVDTENSLPFPGSAGYRHGLSLTFKGHILSVLKVTFRTFAAVLPRLPPSIRRVTRCVLFSVPSASALAIGSYGHPWHHHHPRKSAPCGKPISALHPVVALATALLLARPRC